jgi:hypothetical protein
MMEAHPLIESYSVLLAGFAKGALLVPVDCLTAPMEVEEFNRFRNDINFNIMELLKKNGLELHRPA